MTKAYLYEIVIKSADATGATTMFEKEQKGITKKFKEEVKKVLHRKKLTQQFAFAEKRHSSIARFFHVYATPTAAKALKKVTAVEGVKRATSASYALTINL